MASTALVSYLTYEPSSVQATSTVFASSVPPSNTLTVSTFSLGTGNPTALSPIVITITTTSGKPSTAAASLTTVFTASPTCSELPYTFLWSISGTSTFWHDPLASNAAACWPSDFSTRAGVYPARYSPGVCPTGTPAAAWIPPDTAASLPARSFCCPSGRTLADNGACFTTISSTTTVVMKAPTVISISTPFVAIDWAIVVDWASSDLNRFVPASAPALTTQGTIININGTNGPIPSTPPSLAAGSIAGIVIGALIALAVVLLIGWCLARRRSHRRQSQADARSLHEKGDDKQISELGNEIKRNELATKDNTAELQVHPVELDTDRPA